MKIRRIPRLAFFKPSGTVLSLGTVVGKENREMRIKRPFFVSTPEIISGVVLKIWH